MRNKTPDGLLFDFISHCRGGPGRRDHLSPAQVEQITRTIGRTPEVMVKVLRTGAASPAAVRQHLEYVGRQGEVELLTDDGQQLHDRESTANLIEDWDLDLLDAQSGLGGLRGRRAPKLVHKVVFSMPAGTPPDKVLLATQTFCREQFALKHRYAMALHTDEPHPHVHLIIKAVSEQGKRLNIRKDTLRAWREGFASQLRREGVAANATPRFVRGETRQRKSDGIYRAARRGTSTHMRHRVEAAAVALRRSDRISEPAGVRLRETRAALEREWLATGEALKSQGQVVVAEQIQRFVSGLPPARTEREWLMAGLTEQIRRHRSKDEEMTR